MRSNRRRASVQESRQLRETWAQQAENVIEQLKRAARALARTTQYPRCQLGLDGDRLSSLNAQSAVHLTGRRWLLPGRELREANASPSHDPIGFMAKHRIMSAAAEQAPIYRMLDCRALCVTR